VVLPLLRRRTSKRSNSEATRQYNILLNKRKLEPAPPPYIPFNKAGFDANLSQNKRQDFLIWQFLSLVSFVY
jgi:hypothetical protein